MRIWTPKKEIVLPKRQRGFVLPGMFGAAGKPSGGGGGGGGFPVVESTSTGGSGSTAAQAITLPSGVTNGDLLLVIFSNDGSVPSSITGTGWVQLSQANNGGNSHVLTVYAKIADGSDSLTVNISTDQCEYVCYRISGAGVPEAAAEVTAGKDFSAMAPTGGSAKYLWVLGWGLHVDQSVTAAPTGYTTNLTNVSASGSGAGVAASYRTNEAASEDPGSFTTSAGASTDALCVIAVPPAVAPTYTTLSPNFKHSALVLSNGNKTATHDASATNHQVAGSVDAKLFGKFYFEVTVDVVGATLGGLGIGAGAWNQPFTVTIGNSSAADSVGYLSWDRIYRNGTNTAAGAGTIVNGSVVSVEVDAGSRTIRFRLDGGAWTSTYTISGSQPIVPLISSYDAGAQLTVNFGASAFAYTPTTGYGGWTTNAAKYGRYFRYHNISGNTAEINVAQIALRETSGGSDAVGSGTASASSVFSSPTYTADKAVDGNSSTMWRAGSASGAGAWWQYDFGAGVAKTIVETVHQIRSDALQYPTEIRYLYSSNGVHFYPLLGRNGLTFTLGEAKTITFT